ncbi:unnamed protein product [Symbiodinium sp. CCMP2592]|nr:unnamed protein product [Symbiodinium sp. CCMP2592]
MSQSALDVFFGGKGSEPELDTQQEDTQEVEVVQEVPEPQEPEASEAAEEPKAKAKGKAAKSEKSSEDEKAGDEAVAKEEKQQDPPEESSKAKKSRSDQDREKAAKLGDLQLCNSEPQPPAGQGESRDKNKAWWLSKHLSTMPDDIQKLFLSEKVSRADKTKLINGAVEKKSGGKAGQMYKLNTESAVLQQLSTFYKKVCGKDKVKGKPRALMVAKLGGEEAFKKALATGDVYEVNNNGSLFYCFREIVVTNETGTNNRMSTSKLRKPDQSITDSAAEGFDSFFANFQPCLEPDRAAGCGSELQGGLLALCDKPGAESWTAEASTKVEEALQWANATRISVSKVLSKETAALSKSSVWTTLKGQLQKAWEDLMPLHSDLEKAKLFKNLSLAELRSLLQKAATGLLAAQDLIKGMTALI